MEITLDTREKAHIRAWIIKQFPGVTFKEEALKEGDFLVRCENDKYAKVLIERKTVSDLYGSVVGSKGKKPRFPDQCARLVTHQTDSIVVLLITGSVDDYCKSYKKRTGVDLDPSFFDSVIASVMSRYNIRVLVDPDHEVGIVRALKVGMSACAGKMDLVDSRNCDALIARLLNITLVQWRSIRKVYGTDLTYIAKLPLKDLMAVEGIGKVKAQRIIDILSGKSEDWL